MKRFFGLTNIFRPACKTCGYASPRVGFESGPREKILYITCVRPSPNKPDCLAVVDVDPDSDTYCQVQASTITKIEDQDFFFLGSTR